METLKKIFDWAADYAVSAGLKVLWAIILLIVGLKLIKWLVNIITKTKGFKLIDESAQGFLKGFIRITLKTVLLLTVAAILGVPMTSFVTLIGSAGIAIGLALQGSLSNFAGGLMLLLFKPFKVGEYITVNDTYSGTVSEIGILYTKLITPDNKKIVLTNSVVSNGAIVDANAFDTRRVDLTFGVSYDTDADKVKFLLEDIAARHPLVLKDPAPMIRMNSHDASALTYVFRVWTKKDDYWTVYFDMTETVKREFDNNGIEIPYNQLDVHIKQ